MRKHHYLLLALASIFTLFNSCNDKSKKGISVAMGLLVEDQNKISRIPKADIPFGGTELPSSADMSDRMPEVGSQGGQQSCVAWAIAYAMKGYQEAVQLGEPIKFSPSFVYNQINGGKNVPTQVTDGLNILSEQGVCLMDEMPYDENKWDENPTEASKASAKRFRIDEWRRVNTMDIKEIKTYLAAGSPVIIGAMVTADFIDKGYTEGADYMWKENGESIGGHAMLVVGYDDAKNAFKIINSWGKNWGDGGYGWIDYKLFPEVVMYGFIAKDSYTAPEVVADIKKGNRPTQEPADTQDDFTYTQNDNPTQEDTEIDFRKNNVVYNAQNPDKAYPGPAMRIEGTLDIPARYGKAFYVLVTVYNKETGKPIKTKIYPDYSNIKNEVAGYTDAYQLDDERMKAKWWLHIPYSAFDLPPGKVDLYAIPTLFIDNFGVKNGEQIDFWFKQPGTSE
jgi:C1A family cysteine protease